MENLMKTSRQSLPRKLFSANVTKADDSGGHSSSMGASIPHKSVQNLKREESSGIPIPPRRKNNHIDGYSSFMNSPPSGRHSPNSLMNGSPTMASSPVQSGYLDVMYGSSGSGKVSRAASPQCGNVGGATGCGDYRLGFTFCSLFFFILLIFSDLFFWFDFHSSLTKKCSLTKYVFEGLLFICFIGIETYFYKSHIFLLYA